VATHRIWPSTNGGTVAGDTNTADLGVEFYVTSACTFQGYYWWCATSASTATSLLTFRLFSTTNGTSGTAITAGTVAGSGTLTAGAWNAFTVASPPTLTANTHYRAVITSTQTSVNWYSSTAGYFTTGGGGASNIVNGPLVCPNSTNTLNNAQCSFNEPSASPYFPVSSSGNQNYWLDVSVADLTTFGSHIVQTGQAVKRASLW